MSAYILPPVNAEAINTSNERFGISEEMLVSSSVPETPPAAYAGGTSYALGAQVSTGTPGGVISVWRSLQAANVGHTPSSSPLWWASAGTTYSEWSAATSWAADARVVRSVTGVHAIFQRLAPGGVDASTPEIDATKWARVSATNRWAMFDMLSAVPTVAVSPLVLELAPGRISGLALLAADSGNVHTTMYSGADLIFESSDTFDSTPVESWDDYFFAPFATRSNIVLLNLPTYSDGVVKITITSDSGSITLGKTIVGSGQLLGDTREGARVRRKNFSVVDRDGYGDINGISRRKSIALVSTEFLTDKSIVLRAKAALDSARTTPCVFVGLIDDSGAFAELLTFLGICTDSDVALSNPKTCFLSAEFEGI